MNSSASSSTPFALLPSEVKTVRLRYQHELLSYCDRGTDERFGRIEFAIDADVTPEFKKAVREADEWRPIHDKKGRITGQWAEVCFVPNA